MFKCLYFELIHLCIVSFYDLNHIYLGHKWTKKEGKAPLMFSIEIYLVILAVIPHKAVNSLKDMILRIASKVETPKRSLQR